MTTSTSILAETEEPEKQQVRYAPDGTYRDHLTQAGNSRRFAKEFGDVLRYVRGLGWVGWNGEHWEVESDIRAIGLAKEAALKLYDASRDLARSDSPTQKAHAVHVGTKV